MSFIFVWIFYLLKLNPLISVCISMILTSRLKMCSLDLFALIHSLIICNSAVISSANESPNINDPNASVKKHAKYRNEKDITTNCIIIAKTYPVGFFQSNGSLHSFANRFEKENCQISWHVSQFIQSLFPSFDIIWNSYCLTMSEVAKRMRPLPNRCCRKWNSIESLLVIWIPLMTNRGLQNS